MLTADSRRRSFPSLHRMVYLNTAAEGIPPLEVGEALQQYFGDKQLGMDGRERQFAALEETKSLVAELYAVVAGGGIKRGVVYGESDATGSSPKSNPVHPCDLLPTIYHAFGIDPATLMYNQLNQPRELVKGHPVTELFA